MRRCYAGTLTGRYAGKKGWPVTFEQPVIFPDRFQKALKWSDLTGKERPDKPWLNSYPRVIFLNDMGDTFTESLPLDWLGDFVPAMEASPHIWIILTKRPRRMFEFWESYLAPIRGSGEDENIQENFWLLASVTGPENIGRIRELLKLRALGAKMLGVSYEPALGPVDFTGYHGLDWVIAGGESGPGARPANSDWFRAARNACRSAGVPFFFKQWGEWLPAGQTPAEDVSRCHKYSIVPGRHLRTCRYVGKKAAGAMLDGREWREMPEIRR